MANCAFRKGPLEVISVDIVSWVSPVSTPPSACQSSNTAAWTSDTPIATNHNFFRCSSPAVLSAQQPLQQPQHYQHQLCQYRQNHYNHNYPQRQQQHYRSAADVQKQPWPTWPATAAAPPVSTLALPNTSSALLPLQACHNFQSMAKPKQCGLQLHAVPPPAGSCYNYHIPAVQCPASTAGLFHDSMCRRHHQHLQPQHLQQHLHQHQRQQRHHEGMDIAASPMVVEDLYQAQLSCKGQKRPRELADTAVLDLGLLHANRRACLVPPPPQPPAAPAAAAAPLAAGGSPVVSRRCLQRYNSFESDGSHSDSSVFFAIRPKTIANLSTAATAVSATAVTAGVAVASSSNAMVACTTAPTRQLGAVCQMTSWLPRQALQCALLPAVPATTAPTRTTVTTTAVRGRTGGSHATAFSALLQPPPRLSPLPTPCASHGEDFILNATRALHLCPETSGRLALHIWRRVGAVVRVVLSIRDAGVDGDDPRVASSTYRLHATACLWLASKMEEQRRLVADPRALAAMAQSSAEALCTAELRVLAWVEWCPLRGYLPSPPQRLGLGAARE